MPCTPGYPPDGGQVPPSGGPLAGGGAPIMAVRAAAPSVRRRHDLGPAPVRPRTRRRPGADQGHDPAEHAAELGADPERIIIVGASAGGGLTASLALLLRDRKGPQPLGQVLMCPMLDDRNETPSSHQMAGLGVWDRTANETGWTALLGDSRGGPDVSPYAAPARAEDLSGLPPAFLDVGSAETFRDEVVAYASRIWQAGGVAELHVWPGGFHGFEGFAPQAALSRSARAAHVDWLRRLLGECGDACGQSELDEGSWAAR